MWAVRNWVTLRTIKMFETRAAARAWAEKFYAPMYLIEYIDSAKKGAPCEP